MWHLIQRSHRHTCTYSHIQKQKYIDAHTYIHSIYIYVFKKHNLSPVQSCVCLVWEPSQASHTQYQDWSWHRDYRRDTVKWVIYPHFRNITPLKHGTEQVKSHHKIIYILELSPLFLSFVLSCQSNPFADGKHLLTLFLLNAIFKMGTMHPSYCRHFYKIISARDSVLTIYLRSVIYYNLRL